MAKLIYAAIASLDGYVADEDGSFDWAEPDDEVHAFVNDLERPLGTYLYGRRMYEVMVCVGDTRTAPMPPYIRDYAEIWRDADKIVYSRTLRDGLERADADRAGVRPRRGPAPEGVRRPRHRRSAAPSSPPRPSRPGWSTSASSSSCPIVVGGGTRALPDGVRLQLELLDERRFGNGTVTSAIASAS